MALVAYSPALGAEINDLWLEFSNKLSTGVIPPETAPAEALAVHIQVATKILTAITMNAQVNTILTGTAGTFPITGTGLGLPGVAIT